MSLLSIYAGGSNWIQQYRQNSAQPIPIVSGEPVALFNGYVIDNQRKAVRLAQNEQLPVITANSFPISLGDELGGEEFSKTIELLYQCKTAGIAITEVIIFSKDYIILTTSDTIRVLFNSRSDVVSVSSSLQTMKSVFTIEGKAPYEIDFRYDKPVMRY